MTIISYKTILAKAKSIKTSVEKEYKLGEPSTWCYYIAKCILNHRKDTTKITLTPAEKSTGDTWSRQVYYSTYIDMAERLCKYVEQHHKLPNYITVNNMKMKVSDYTYMFSRILVYYDLNEKYPKYAEVNSKAFVKPDETTNEVYDYFVKVFGTFDNTIDDALAKIAGKKYGYYYDDVYSNKQSIDRMKNGQGVNCTDSCHVFYNIVLALIKKGKYRKVECLHIKCRGGDGHVRLRITKNDGNYIYRDPAAVLDSGSLTYNWCMNGTLIAINPSWFMANLNR